jgi:hypothetical protein
MVAAGQCFIFILLLSKGLKINISFCFVKWLCLGRRADWERGVCDAAAVGDVVGVGEGRRLHLLTRVLHCVPQLEVDLLL